MTQPTATEAGAKSLAHSSYGHSFNTIEEFPETLVCGIDAEDDDTDDTQAAKDAGAQSTAKLYEWLREVVPDLTRSDEFVRKVIVQKLSLKPATVEVESVADSLRHSFPGVGVYIRHATGTRSKSACLSRLRHKSIVLKPLSSAASGSADAEIIVELSFKDSFALPNPSPRYQAVIDLLPDIYAAPAACFFAAVKFIAEEIAASFQSKGQVVPPWRTFQALRSKWWRATASDTPPPAASPQAAPSSAHPCWAVPALDSTPQHVIIGFSQAGPSTSPAASPLAHPQSTTLPPSPGPSQPVAPMGYRSAPAAMPPMRCFGPGALQAPPATDTTCRASEAAEGSAAVTVFRSRPRSSLRAPMVPLDKLLLPVRTVKLGGTAVA